MTLDIVTRCTVRDALRHLSRDRSPGETPLTELETVRRSLTGAGFRATSGTRRFEIARLLGGLAEEELVRLRAIVLGHEHAELADPLDPIATMDRLLADFAHDHADLEGASAVYHLYIRSDLGLGLLDLVALLGDRHRRTLQRRLQRGVRLITSRLRELEMAAQIQARDERLARRVPAAPEPLFGQHALLARLMERLDASAEGPSITALRGEAGIGKSAIAAALGRRALDAGRVDDIAWVEVGPNGRFTQRSDSPDTSAIEILDHAASQLNDGAPGKSAVFGQRKSLMVIDGLDAPDVARAVVGRLDSAGGPCFTILTGRVGWADTSVPRVVDVPPLARADALRLLRHEFVRRGMAVAAVAPDAALAPIAGAAGGHPGALKRAAAMLRASSIDRVARDIEQGGGEAAAYAQELWQEAWAATPPDTRAVVRAVSTSNREPSDMGDRGRPGERFDQALRDAVDRGMLVRGEGLRPTFRTAHFLRRFVRHAERKVERPAGKEVEMARDAVEFTETAETAEYTESDGAWQRPMIIELSHRQLPSRNSSRQHPNEDGRHGVPTRRDRSAGR